MGFFVRPSPTTHDQHAPDQRVPHTIEVDRCWPHPLTRHWWAVVAAKPVTHLYDFSAVSRRPFVISGQRGNFWNPHSNIFPRIPILPSESHKKNCTFLCNSPFPVIFLTNGALSWRTDLELAMLILFPSIWGIACLRLNKIWNTHFMRLNCQF